MNTKQKTNSLKIAFKPLDKKYIIIFVTLVLMSTVSVILSVINAKVLGQISEKILYKNEVNNVIITFCSILFLKSIISFIQTLIQIKYTANIEQVYKEYTERALMNSTMKWIRKQNEGDILTKMSNNLSQASSYAGRGLLAIIFRVISIVTSIIVISVINYKIMVFLIPLIAIAIVLQMLAGKPLQPKRKELMDSVGSAISIANDGMNNYWQIKINGLEKWFINRFDKSLLNIKRTYIKIFPQIIAFMSISFIFSIIPLIFLLFYGSYLCTANQLSVSQYITIITLGIPLTSVMTGLSQDVANMQTSKAALTRLTELWNSPKDHVEFEKSDIFKFSKQGHSAVKINNISFGYLDNDKIFDDLNLDFKRGKKYIIVGRNGSGKSTLINILAGLYTPHKGKITYAFGEKQLGIDKFRNKISVVEQDSYLFEDSVINNIFVNDETTNSEYIKQWYDNSFVREIIDKLPKGKDTLVNEGGSNLSGGQKRCINIARGLVKESDIVILDEPTANIDSNTAKIVSKEIVRMCDESKKTVIIITHDESLLDIGQDVERIQLDKLDECIGDAAI